MRVHIDCEARDLDVGFTYPPGAKARKGQTVRLLKSDMSWVNYDVSQ